VFTILWERTRRGVAPVQTLGLRRTPWQVGGRRHILRIAPLERVSRPVLPALRSPKGGKTLAPRRVGRDVCAVACRNDSSSTHLTFAPIFVFISVFVTTCESCQW